MSTRPEALDWSVDNCTVGRALDVIGDRSTFIVLREVFNGIRRFDDMRVRTSISRQVLTDRLAVLVDEGVLRREPYREPGQRLRHEYRLTEKGLALYPVFVALNEWGTAWYGDPDGSPLSFGHRADGCGGEVSVVLSCSAGHEVAAHRDVVTRRGPGVRRRVPA